MLSRLFKKLDILIVKAFIGPFVATFFITLFVLVLQFMWLYIDDVVGKGLSAFIVLQLLVYVAATVVPLAMPLAVLLSSIMTMGNLGETFELVAIKSAGISLLRFLRPLFVVSLGLTLVAFYFNNNILPLANLKMNTLKYDIIMKKPALNIKEGVFFDKIEGFVIKIGKKEKDDSTIRSVVIYEQNNTGNAQDNVIVADRGTMVVTPNQQNLIFTLYDGSRYQEQAGKGGIQTGTELTRMSFKKYKKVMDLSTFKMTRTDDSNFRNNYQMKTLPQLGHAIDSVRHMTQDYSKRAGDIVAMNVKVKRYLDTTGWDKVEKAPTPVLAYLKPEAIARDSVKRLWVTERKRQDSLKHAKDSIDKVIAAATKKKPSAPAPVIPANPDVAIRPVPNAPQDPVFADLMPDSVYSNVLERTISTISAAKTGLDQPAIMFSNEDHNLRQMESSWHEKITMAVAVLVMFLIGAPLGSIIRKGVSVFRWYSPSSSSSSFSC
ncbi:LptF/LptG family permease [Puia sp. P3]|uniref:LptF/LptG family permease n=1 Tax=Puia sp. P3 TaxID=3423952 RepID=UPI003D67BF71